MTLVGAGAGMAPTQAKAATLLDIPSTTVASGWFTPQTFDFSFSVSEAFTNLSLFLTDGNQRVDVPLLGNLPLFGGLFNSATLTGTSISPQTIGGSGGMQALAAGDYINTFSGVIGPGSYSLQLSFLQLPVIPTDFQGTLSAAVVPEPAEWMMMLGGLAVVGFAARRRAKGNAKVSPKLLAG